MAKNKINLKKILNIKVLIIATILILLVGGLFFWQSKKEIKGNVEDYQIKETVDGVFVENKKAGLSMRVPDNWNVEKVDVGEGSVIVQTLDIDGKDVNGLIIPPFETGCGIETTVTYKGLSFEEIEQDAREIHRVLMTQYEEFEEILINDNEALKNTWESATRGPMVTIFIPKNDKVYVFNLSSAPEEKDRCIQEFEGFLEAISIQ